MYIYSFSLSFTLVPCYLDSPPPPPSLLPQSIPINDQKLELVVHLYYKQLQSDLPTRVRCSDPGESEEGSSTALCDLCSKNCRESTVDYITGDIPVDRGRIKQAFLTLPIAEAFQNLFLDQNIEQG